MMPLQKTEQTAEYWVELDRKYRLQSRPTEPLVLVRGEGIFLWDVAGNRYMDFESGQFGMISGHLHPQVSAAAHGQIDRLMHHSLKFLNIPRIQLAERLARITPGALAHSYFCCSGSEANEAALRLAKKATGRFEVVAVLRGYHGRSAGSASLSSAYVRERVGYGPLLTGVTFIPAPYCYRCPFGQSGQANCHLACFEYAVDYIDRTTSGEPAAVILEFIQGAGGVNCVPLKWARAVRSFCDERGALLIDDEALTGVGRTGKWFACEHYNITPDILTTSKGLGGGVPCAAMVTSSLIAEHAISFGYDQAASHMGDPFQCAVALANLDVVESHGLLEQANFKGAKLVARLHELQSEYECIGDVRGLGLLIGVEVVADRESKKPAVDIAARITLESRKRGLLLGGVKVGARHGQNVLRLAPPLIVSDAELEDAMGIVADALAAATR
jgi:2,2-dialkylglycine decarboxylase (pyruvate)